MRTYEYACIGAALITVASIATVSFKLPLEGPATVLDGDTIVVRNTHIRLSGIDAPELKQTCLKDSQLWNCGIASKTALDYMTAGARVSCSVEGYDKFNRVLATCYVGSINLNETMVRLGMAVAYTRYSTRYLEVQESAEADRRGIWSSTFTQPETFRHKEQR